MALPAKRAVLAAAAVLALVAVPQALACGSSGYTYAGLASATNTDGVGAKLTAIRAPAVKNGHVAGWVGVGGPKEGPNGRDEWIQVGLSAFQGSSESSLYYEVTRAGSLPRYVSVETNLPAGTSKRIAVLEVGGRPNWWRVWVDGRAVSKPIYLPGSDRRWQGIATAESWGGNGRPVCNGFGYRFDNVVVAQHAGGSWQPLSNPLRIQSGGYQLLRSTSSSFEAISPLSNKPTPKSSPAYIASTNARPQ